MPKSSRPPHWTRIAAGIVAGLVLHGVAGWWSPAALAAGSGATNSTITLSTSSHTSFESPPACGLVGSSRSVQTVTLEESIGGNDPITGLSTCTIIGNRDNFFPTRPCLPQDTQVSLPSDPVTGRWFYVLAGWTNLNVNTHTETFQCVAAASASVAVPALPWPALLGLGNLLLGLGTWQLARRRRRVSS